MKCIVDFNDTEVETSQQMSLNHEHRDMQIWATDVMVLRCENKTPEAAAPLSALKKLVACRLSAGTSLLTHHVSKTTSKRPDVVLFLDQIAGTHVLPHHHGATRQRLDPSKHPSGNNRPMVCRTSRALFYLPPYSLELNRMEIFRKHSNTVDDASSPGPRKPSIPRSKNYSSVSAQPFKSNFVNA